MSQPMKVGLVLSGGGAKGAYQVGMLKALYEQGVTIDAISGASIGALNGAILAGSNSLAEGVKRLQTVWNTLANTSPLKLNRPNYLTLLASAGLSAYGSVYFSGFVRTLDHVTKKNGIALPSLSSGLYKSLNSGLLSDAPLQALMDEYLQPTALMHGTPLYISVYQSGGGILDVVKVAAAELGLKDTDPSTFFHIQRLPEDQQRALLLGSAALPMIFAPKDIAGTSYSDGGQGGWQSMQGNTPAQPLVDAGCNLIIVSHLSDGSLWSRRDFPGATVLEIRPQSTLARDTGYLGSSKDLLGFDATKILSWIEQGYQDTLIALKPLMEACHARGEWQTSQHAVAHSERRNDSADEQLKQAMMRLTRKD